VVLVTEKTRSGGFSHLLAPVSVLCPQEPDQD